MSDVVISLRDVWVHFVMPGFRNRGVKQTIIDALRGRHVKREKVFFDALKGVTFEVNRGEILGLIGENGSGKSTVLNLIAGIYRPDAGEVRIDGRVSALLELGTGFHPELTGRENVQLTGSLLGLSTREIEERFSAIEEFAGIGQFIDVPIKTYSSGMYIRLAFALAISVDADILLIDEVLSVGDHSFQQKCFRKIMEFREQGKTIIFVSHDLPSVRHLCRRTIVFHEGQLLRDGDTRHSIDYYYQRSGRREAIAELFGKTWSLLFNNGRFGILAADRLLTAESGCYLVLTDEDHEIPSFSGYWTVIENQADRLVCEGNWSVFGIRLRWEFHFDDDQLELVIRVFSEAGEGLRQIAVHLEVDPSFNRWADIVREGRFPETFSDDMNRITLTGLIDNTRFLLLEGDTALPSIVLEQQNNSVRTLCQLLSSDSTHRSHLISMREFFPPHRTHEQLREHRTRFRLSVGLSTEAVAAKRRSHRDGQSLSHGPFSLIFTGQHFHLLYDGHFLTTMLGLYTSHRSAQTWHDTSQAWWTVERDHGILRGICRLKRLAIQQEMAFQFTESGDLQWSVWRDVLEEVSLDRLQINIMLSEEYGRWTDGSRNEGSFPTWFSTDFGGDWEVVRSDFPEKGPIAVSGSTRSDERDDLPAVSFSLQEPCDNFQANIINSDSFFHSRLLQFLTIPPTGNHRFKPGRTLFARTLIRVRPPLTEEEPS